MDPADDPSIQFTGTDTGPPTRRREADSGLGMSVGGNVLEEIIGEDVVLGQEGEVENLQREEEERQGVNLNPLGEEAMLLLAPDNERNVVQMYPEVHRPFTQKEPEVRILTSMSPTHLLEFTPVC